ncbi:hypothetical protein IRJ41_018078, partial [Triplophysa rosa]
TAGPDRLRGKKHCQTEIAKAASPFHSAPVGSMKTSADDTLWGGLLKQRLLEDRYNEIEPHDCLLRESEASSHTTCCQAGCHKAQQPPQYAPTPHYRMQPDRPKVTNADEGASPFSSVQTCKHRCLSHMRQRQDEPVCRSQVTFRSSFLCYTFHCSPSLTSAAIKLLWCGDCGSQVGVCLYQISFLNQILSSDEAECSDGLDLWPTPHVGCWANTEPPLSLPGSHSATQPAEEERRLWWPGRPVTLAELQVAGRQAGGL